MKENFLKKSEDTAVLVRTNSLT